MSLACLVAAGKLELYLFQLATSQLQIMSHSLGLISSNFVGIAAGRPRLDLLLPASTKRQSLRLLLIAVQAKHIVRSSGRYCQHS